MKKTKLLFLASLCLLLLTNVLHAANSGSWPLQLVTVGDPGNAPESANFLSFYYSDSVVTNDYQIGMFTITAGQYCDFLNSVGSSDPYGCYDTNMGATNTHLGTISRSGSLGSYTYAMLSTNSSNLPIVYLDWFRAARFCNWMFNYCTNAPEGYDSTEQGSYFLNGATNGSLIAPGINATWLIPNDNQWRKAAYYKGGSTNAGYWAYATKSNVNPNNTLSGTNTNGANWMNLSTNYATTGTAYSNSYLTPVGLFTNSPGPYGTFDMAGNVQEIINNQWAYWGTLQTLGGSYGSSTLQQMSKTYINQLPVTSQTGFRICAPTGTVSSDYSPSL